MPEASAMRTRTAAGASSIGRPIVAALCAGGLFLMVFATDPAMDAVQLVPFAPLAVPFGFVLAIVPCLVGSAGLHALGKGNEGVRLPAFWGVIGGLVAGGPAALAGAEPALVAAFAATGAISALICRYGTRWA